MQPQYRNYPPAAQAQHRSPHATTSRRGPGPMVQPHPHAVPNAQHVEAARRAEQERRERARRLSNHPTDKNMPDGVDEVCIGDGVSRYRQLREIERKLDATMMRKKLDISDSVTRSQVPRFGTMRIWVWNTVENQPWQQGSGIDAEQFDFDAGSDATYRVTIAGKLLEEDIDVGLSGEDGEEDEKENGNDPDAMDEDTDAATAEKKNSSKPPHQKPQPFSKFFKSIVIDFDRSPALQPDQLAQIEWKRPEAAGPNAPAATTTPAEQNFSQLEFSRKGDENINITISLTRYDQPERYRLSKPLANLLDTDEDDRAGVMMGIWEYVKTQGLQSEEDDRKIVCDAALKAVFNADTVFFPFLPQAVQQHLHALPPVELRYTIRVDKDYISGNPELGIEPCQKSVFDVQVSLPDPVRPLITTLFRQPNNLETLSTIHRLDEDIALLVRAISQSKAKHAFFNSMAADPVTFVKRWISSQQRDLEVILGEAPMGWNEEGTSEEWRRGGEQGVWGSDVARESVGLWLARRDMPKP